MRLSLATLSHGHRSVVVLVAGLGVATTAMLGSVVIARQTPAPIVKDESRLLAGDPLRAEILTLRAELAAARSEIATLRAPLDRPAPVAALDAPAIEEPAAAIAEEVAPVAPLQLAAIDPGEITRVVPSTVIVPPVDPVVTARAYLIRTAFPGGTMTMLGRDKSIGCFHPAFARNLAAAVADARTHGLPDAGVLSGCRPPALGVGGFADKFNSLHAYGLAADMHGIGSPGSETAKRWHRIAAQHGVACVYGPYNRAEWNHCQGTRTKVAPGFLRKTITAKGPSSLERMWSAAQGIVLAAAGTLDPVKVASATPDSKPTVKVAKRHKAKAHRTRMVRRHHHRRHRRV